MQDTQYADGFIQDPIGDEARGSADNQLPRALHPAETSAFRKVDQAYHGLGDADVHKRSRTRVIGFNVIVDRPPILQGVLRPDESYALPAAKLAARRAANSASTSSCATSGRMSSSASRTLARNQAS